MQLPQDDLRYPNARLPNPSQPRYYTVRQQSYPWKEPYDGGDVPNIRLHGHWLASAGFTAGKAVRVVATPGVIELHMMESSKPLRDQDSVSFSKLVANNAAFHGHDALLDHPGRLLHQHLLAKIGATTLEFARAIGVEQDFAECFLAGDEDVDLDLALRLGFFCRTEQELWLRLQAMHSGGVGRSVGDAP